MLQTVQDALNRRDAAGALNAARALVDSAPERADTHHALGLALKLGGDLAPAAVAFARAVELDPEHAGYRLAAASVAMAQRDFANAEQALDEALRLDPNLLPAYAMRAQLALGRGDVALADELGKRAERIADDHPLTLCMRGNLALARNDHALAQRALHRASQLAPNEPMVLTSLALAYLAGGNHAFGEQSLRRALQHDPSSLPLHRLLVNAIHAQGRHADLPAVLEQLLAQAPGDAGALTLLAETQVALGQRDAALDSYRRLLALPGLPGEAIDAALQPLVRSRDWPAIWQLFDERINAEPDDEAWWQRRLAVSAGVDPDWTATFINNWQQRHPASGLPAQALATRLEQQHDLDAAEAQADAALARQPTLLPAAAVKVRAELRRDPAAALARLDGLLAAPLEPRSAEGMQRLRAVALDRLDRTAEATDAIRAAAALRGERISLPRPRVPVDPPTPDPNDPPVQPRLLWGPPGSRVVEVAAMLRALPDSVLLDDRFGPRPRADGLGPDRPDGAIATALGWAQVLAQAGVDHARVIDWLPFRDERLASALPAARWLIALDDPRDLLLNWQVFGGRFAGGPAPAPEIAAEWLKLVLAPLAERIAAGDPQILVVDGATARSDGGAAAANVQRFFTLDSTPDGGLLQVDPVSLGDLPAAFLPGHWRRYAEPLAAAFATLQPLAVKLGYPAD